jgi:hypothetical protein
VIARGKASGAGDLIEAGTIRVGHRVERIMADHAQHLCDLGVVGADVALDEGVVVLEVEQGGLGHDRASGQLGRAVRPAGLTAAGRLRAGSLAAPEAPRAPLSFCLRVWKRAAWAAGRMASRGCASCPFGAGSPIKAAGLSRVCARGGRGT